MLNKYIKTEKHTVVDKHVVEAKRYCDVCGAWITGPYWEVTRHHGDWGNDSIDSYEYWDCCSKKCVCDRFERYMHDSENGFNTQCFSVEHENESVKDYHMRYDPDEKHYPESEFIKYIEVEDEQ